MQRERPGRLGRSLKQPLRLTLLNIEDRLHAQAELEFAPADGAGWRYSRLNRQSAGTEVLGHDRATIAELSDVDQIAQRASGKVREMLGLGQGILGFFGQQERLDW